MERYIISDRVVAAELACGISYTDSDADRSSAARTLKRRDRDSATHGTKREHKL